MTTAYRYALPLLAWLAVGCGDDTNVGLDGGVADLSAAADLSHTTAQLKLTQTNLVADTPDAGATTTDPNLVNAWGMAFNPAGPIWIADNHSGLATVYTAAGAILPIVVTIPPPAGGTPPAAPTGQVFNGTNTNFMGDIFIFSTEDGTISGWQSGTNATLRKDNSGANAIYKGLALATSGGASRLFATDFHNGKVDVFDQMYMPVTTAGGFTDPNIPAGFAPFGIQAAGATLYVTYAKQGPGAMDDAKGPGNGFVDLFDFDGHLTKRVVSNGALNSPWGIAVAPQDFGSFGGAIVVGNFGDGAINVYNASTGDHLASATNASGAPLLIDGLWSLVFGNDTTGASHKQLFFTAGPNDENNGLFGRLDLAP